MKKSTIKTISVFLTAIGIASFSIGAMASVKPNSCPKTHNGVAFAAAFSVSADWKKGQPALVSCDYGLQTDGSYKTFMTYYNRTANLVGTTSWQPDPNNADNQQCLSSDPKQCPIKMVG